MENKEYPPGKEPNGLVNDDRLTAFLHILMRDHLPFGAVERILREHLDIQGQAGAVYEHETTLRHAEFMARRVLGE